MASRIYTDINKDLHFPMTVLPLPAHVITVSGFSLCLDVASSETGKLCLPLKFGRTHLDGVFKAWI